MTELDALTEGAPRLGKRLLAAALQACGLALLLSAVLMSAYAYFSLHNDLLAGIRVQAQVTGYNSVAPLLFNDAAAATETLASLRAAEGVVCAVVQDEHGGTFARYESGGQGQTRADAGCGAAGRRAGQYWETAGVLYVNEAIVHSGRAVGNIVVGASLASLHQRVMTYVATGVGAALLALVFAYVRILRVRRDVDHTERQLEELVYTDPVSQLLNRRAANHQLETLQRQTSAGFVMALLDLDDFKLVNDTHGHPAGDELLLVLGRRLAEQLAPEGRVFRYGGDEFLLLFPNTAETEKYGFGQRILQVLQPLLTLETLETRMMSVRGSVGLAHFPSDADNTSDLLRAADTAMYRAKQGGKNSYASYTPGMDLQLRRRLRLLGELRRALERDEFRLAYQPIVDLVDGRIVGVEALLRWHHPELGLVGPSEFIPAAEENGLILDVGDWVLKAAARQVAQWRARDAARMNDFYVAVNVSAKQLSRGLQDQVCAALAFEGLPAHALQIEITEYSVVEAMDANIEQLAGLRRSGVKVAIDDFGTGLSSLGYLKRLPIDKLKIDRAFVKDLPGTSEDGAIASAIVSLAQNLGLQIVAEGVETEAQASWLKRAGCEFGQGYLFSRPVSAAQLEALLDGTAEAVTTAPAALAWPATGPR